MIDDVVYVIIVQGHIVLLNKNYNTVTFERNNGAESLHTVVGLLFLCLYYIEK